MIIIEGLNEKKVYDWQACCGHCPFFHHANVMGPGYCEIQYAIIGFEACTHSLKHSCPIKIIKENK